jgi:hypothetical protein
VLLLLGLAVQLAPVLLLPMVLTQDGPAHLDGAWVLRHHGDDGPVGAALRSNYWVDLRPVPNLLTTLLLAGLLRVLGPDTAEKVVVAGFMVLLVAGLRFALRGVDRRAGWLAVAALPLAGAELVAFGFYNFCWGVALGLFVVGMALRCRDGWTIRHTVTAALLLVLTWSAHLLPWMVTVLLVGALAVGRWVVTVRAGAGAGVGRAVKVHLLPPVLAVLPTVALSAGYVLGGGGQHGAVAGAPSIARVGWLLTLYRPLVVSSWWELVPAVAVTLVLGRLAVAARRPGPVGEGTAPADGPLAGSDRLVLGASAVAAAAAVLLSPARLGPEYGFLPERLAWFPPLLLVLFCATRMPSRSSARRAVAVVLVLAATTAALVRLPTQLADQRTAAEFLSVAGDLPPGAVFAVLRFSGHEASLAPLKGAPDPLRHLSSRLAVAAGAVDVGHYEAIYPYFQARFLPGSVRETIDPGLNGLERIPPSLHLDAAGNRLQYVLVVGLDRAEGWVRSAHRTAGVLADLRAGYVQVATSGPSGYVSVWRLRDGTDG